MADHKDLNSHRVLQDRVHELVAWHGGYAAAARVLKIDKGYLHRLASGAKVRPSDKLLRRMGLRRVVAFERVPTATRFPKPHG